MDTTSPCHHSEGGKLHFGELVWGSSKCGLPHEAGWARSRWWLNTGRALPSPTSPSAPEQGLARNRDSFHCQPSGGWAAAKGQVRSEVSPGSKLGSPQSEVQTGLWVQAPGNGCQGGWGLLEACWCASLPGRRFVENRGHLWASDLMCVVFYFYFFLQLASRTIRNE